MTFNAVAFILESFVLSDSVSCSYQGFISKDRVACKPQEDEGYEWKTGCKLNVEVETSHQHLAEHTIDHVPANNHQHGESAETSLTLAVMIVEDGEEVDRTSY